MAKIIVKLRNIVKFPKTSFETLKHVQKSARIIKELLKFDLDN